MKNATTVVPAQAMKLVTPRHRLSFVEAYGKLGPPILFIAIISILWTIWLICLNIAPNATANYLMNTGELDNGDFWLILKPDVTLLVFTVLCLVVVLIVYGIVVLRMTLWRNIEPRSTPSSPSMIDTRYSVRVLSLRYSSNTSKTALRVLKDLTSFNGRHRKQWNMLLKAVDLTLQMLTLYRILEYGFSPMLCFGYAALVATNALSCVVFILNPKRYSALTEVLVDSLFDMLFAVGAPIMLLEYAYTGFRFDRKQAMLVHNIMIPGSFEHQARLVADPREVNNFLLCFDALRTNTWSGLAVQTVMNVSFGYRLLRVVQVYSESRRQTQLPPIKSENDEKNDRRQVVVTLQTQTHVPRVFALAFLAVGIIAILFTHESINHSTEQCNAHPECAAFAYRWTKHKACPCLVYIDVVKAPKTWEEWTDPKDVTASVAAMAVSGDLLVLNIVNRGLPVWPEELSRCTNLRHISLLYTGLEEIPSWAAGFTKLEFLSIDGKLSDTKLTEMPSDLFDRMRVLSRIHLGTHKSLQSLPAMDGLVNLQSLSLALLPSLSSLPDLSALSELRLLQLLMLPNLYTLPAGPPTLIPKVELQISGVCCGGFLGSCNLSYASCTSLTDCQSPAESTWPLWSSFRKAATTVCTWDTADPFVPADKLYPDLERSEVDVCEGHLYRQCELPDVDGLHMCFNDRFRAIACSTRTKPIELRRAEILEGVGEPCNPVYEAWLGCVGN